MLYLQRSFLCESTMFEDRPHQRADVRTQVTWCMALKLSLQSLQNVWNWVWLMPNVFLSLLYSECSM